jgi:flagellar assembly protein FliH
MSRIATVLRSVAWRDESVRVRPPSSGGQAVPSRGADADGIGYAEGLRRGLEQGRAEGFQAGIEEGHAVGLAKGLDEGRLLAQEEFRVVLADMREQADGQESQLAGLARAMERAVAAAVAHAEDELVVICMDVLCQVVGQAIVMPDGLRTQVTRLLADHDPARAVSIHLHPNDAVLLDRAAVGTNRTNLTWVADPEVTVGGCIVQGALQTVDARLEVVLDAVRSALLEGRASHLRQSPPAAGAAA